MPLNSETSLEAVTNIEENSTTNVPVVEPTKNLPQIQPEVTINPQENAIEVEVPEITKEIVTTDKNQDSESVKESLRSVDDLKSLTEEGKKSEDKEEDSKFKDTPSEESLEELQKQSELWKDFADDFSLLADRMPDLTEEDYDELKKEGAMPFNFLKSLDSGKKVRK